MRAATNGEMGQILPIPLGKAAYRANPCICFSETDDSSMEGNTAEERLTNCHYTLLCSDPRRRVAAATRCESSVSNTFAPMYVCM